MRDRVLELLEREEIRTDGRGGAADRPGELDEACHPEDELRRRTRGRLTSVRFDRR
jgi:hypothetical protein